jgi:parvulin-like peptidyl-prolyl isomerase
VLIRLDLANSLTVQTEALFAILILDLRRASSLPVWLHTNSFKSFMMTPRTAIQRLLRVIASVFFSTIVFAQGPSQDLIREALTTTVPEDPAAVVAVVGKTPILAGDIMPRVNGRIKEITDQTPHEPTPQEMQYMQSRLFRSLLAQTIQLKMLRESFLLSQVGTQNADKRNEAESKLQARARQMFAESELPRLYKQLGVNSVNEVDAALRAKGSSFESTKRDFIDQMLAYLYQSDQIKKDPPVTLIEIQNYYDDHKSKYEVKAQVRWEQLTATFEKSGGREGAIAAINEMGREAFYGGSMQAVAKAKSQEPFASRGGVHDWTNRGSLASTILEEQLFKLPTGAMSEVIEDTDAMHIVRILERREAGVRPISELQDDIREILKQQKIAEMTQKVMKEMVRRVPVWTLFPEDVEGSLKLALATPSPTVR